MEGYEIYPEFSYKENEISLREFLGDDFYYDLLELADHDKQRMLRILESFADKSGFFDRLREFLYEL